MSVEVRSQHVVYRGADVRIHMLLLTTNNNTWRPADLNDSAHVPSLVAAGDPATYTVGTRSQHVVYRAAADGNLHMLWYDGQWHEDTLNARANAVTARAAGKPAPYAVFGGGQHVVYRAEANGHLNALTYDGKDWHHTDLYGEAGVADSAPAAAGDPAAYSILGGGQHVVYRDIDGHPSTLWHDGHRWQQADLTTRISGVSPAAGDPAAYGDLDSQHVIYRDGLGRLQALTFDSDGWRRKDLHKEPAVVNSAPPAVGDPAANAIPGGGQHVVYRAGDGHLHALTYTGSWRHTNLFTEPEVVGLAPDAVGTRRHM